MAVVIAILLGLAVVVTFVWSVSWFFRRLEIDNGDLDDGTTPALRYRVPVGIDTAAAVVSLHHQGYEVTTRYEHGETDLYIATVTGGSEEREVIRALIYNAGAALTEDWHLPARSGTRTPSGSRTRPEVWPGRRVARPGIASDDRSHRSVPRLA